MSTRYPDNYDSYTDKQDNISDARAQDVNDLQDAIMAIQEELGTNVAGRNQPSGWTLASRLDRFINDNGTLKATVLTSSDIPSGSISNTKIFHEDTFDFKQINVGQHSDGITYGYSGSGPGPDAGVTIDEDGNIWCDGNITVKGGQAIQASETITTNLNVHGNSYLGDQSTDITEIHGTLRPAVTSQYNIGSSTKRWKSAYIDIILGQSTGGETLTVGTSGVFDNTIAIKSSTDSSSGDALGFIGIKNQDLIFQSGTGKNLRLQPYEGITYLDGVATLTNPNTGMIVNSNIVFNDGSSKITAKYDDIDTYNFYIKYPYVQENIQQQFIASPGTVISTSAKTDVAASGNNLIVDVTINNDRLNEIGDLYTFPDITNAVTTKTDFVSGDSVVLNDALGISIIQTGSIVSGQDLKIGVKVRKI